MRLNGSASFHAPSIRPFYNIDNKRQFKEQGLQKPFKYREKERDIGSEYLVQVYFIFKWCLIQFSHNNKYFIIKDRYLFKDWNGITVAFENTKKSQKVTVSHAQRVVET